MFRVCIKLFAMKNINSQFIIHHNTLCSLKVDLSKQSEDNKENIVVLNTNKVIFIHETSYSKTIMNIIGLDKHHK